MNVKDFEKELAKFDGHAPLVDLHLHAKANKRYNKSLRRQTVKRNALGFKRFSK